MVVAAQHSEAQRQRSGESMKERFLLHRIALQCSDIPLRNVERACPVEANFADARQSVEDDAPMAARKASHPVVVKLLVKNTLDRTLRENIFKGAGFSGPGCQSLSPEKSLFQTGKEVKGEILRKFYAVAVPSGSGLEGSGKAERTTPWRFAPPPFLRGNFSSVEVTKPVYTFSGTTKGARYSRVSRRSASLSLTNLSLLLSNTKVRPVR